MTSDPVMRSRLPFIGLALLASCGAQAPRTNVILIVVDTLRADALIAAETTNIDSLALDGVVFENTFSHAPLTLPAHAALFSSQLAHETGLTNNGQDLGATVPLLAEWLRAEGYHGEGAVSLATLWPNGDHGGIARGFRDYRIGTRPVRDSAAVNADLLSLLANEKPMGGLFLFAHYSDPHQPYNAHGTRAVTARMQLPGTPVATGMTSMAGMTGEELIISDACWVERTFELPATGGELLLTSSVLFVLRSANLTIDGVEIALTRKEGAHKEQRIALPNPQGRACTASIELWLHDSPSLAELQRRYTLEVEAVDLALGELFSDLKSKGLYDSSLIILTADHGEGLGEHSTVGHGRHLYDELLHVPLIIKAPMGSSQTADLTQSVTRLVRHIDVVPTLLELLDLPPMPGARGRSLLRPLPGDPSSPRTVNTQLHEARTMPPEAPGQLYSLRDQRYKLILTRTDASEGTDSFEFYDTQQDPGEVRNRLSDLKATRPTWKAILRAASSTGDAFEPPMSSALEHQLRALGYW